MSSYNDPVIGSLESRKKKSKREHEIKIECASETNNRTSSLSKTNEIEAKFSRYSRSKPFKSAGKDKINVLKLPK